MNEDLSSNSLLDGVILDDVYMATETEEYITLLFTVPTESQDGFAHWLGQMLLTFEDLLFQAAVTSTSDDGEASDDDSGERERDIPGPSDSVG